MAKKLTKEENSTNGAVFMILGVTFLILGFTGQIAFLGVGVAFIAVGYVYYAQAKKDGELKISLEKPVDKVDEGK